MTRSRSTQRAEFTDTVRLRLLEDDADDIEAIVLQWQNELRDARSDFDTKYNDLRKVLMGILVSVATACILLAINVIVIGGKS